MTIEENKLVTFNNNELSDADEVLTNTSFILNNMLNYIIDGASTTAQENLITDFYTSDTAEVYNMNYDAGTDNYKTIDWSSANMYYVDIHATSISSIGDFEINSCTMTQMSANIWRLWHDATSLQLGRARVIKTLFSGSGNTGSDGDPRVSSTYITGLTALKTNRTEDVGKRIIYANATGANGTNTECYYTGTFLDTTSNTDCSVWSFVSSQSGGSIGNGLSAIYFPNSTSVNSGGGTWSWSNSNDEFGTDTSAEDQDNPANIRFFNDNNGNNSTVNGNFRILTMTSSAMTWAIESGTGITSNTIYDYYIDGQIPLFTAAESSTNLTSTLITAGTTITTDVKNVLSNTDITLDPTSSVIVVYTFNDGTTWENGSDHIINNLFHSGTKLKIKYVITRTDITKIDSINKVTAWYG